MLAGEIVSLMQMKTGESGKVVDVLGGRRLFHRLEALGLRIGKRVTKKSGGLWWGPVTVQVGGSQIGIGHGMAAKVMVELEK